MVLEEKKMRLFLESFSISIADPEYLVADPDPDLTKYGYLDFPPYIKYEREYKKVKL